AVQGTQDGATSQVGPGAAAEPASRGAAAWVVRTAAQQAAGEAARPRAIPRDRAVRKQAGRSRVAAADIQPGPAQPGEPGADPLPKFGRRLAGEGEAQDPSRAHHAVSDQPDQPGGHGLALA